MYLLLDLSTKDAIHIALFDEKDMHEKEAPGRNRELLFFIDEFLREEGVDKKKVEGIMVVVGAGGFTSTRLAVTVANTFTYVQKIPILAITKEQVGSVQGLIPELLKFEACPPKPGGRRRGQYISATYSGEANVGKEK